MDENETLVEFRLTYMDDFGLNTQKRGANFVRPPDIINTNMSESRLNQRTTCIFF